VRSKAVGSIAPAAVVMIPIFFSLAAIAAAIVDERSRVDNRHFDLWRIYEDEDENDNELVQFKDIAKR
jgi:hypothetical protein